MIWGWFRLLIIIPVTSQREVFIIYPGHTPLYTSDYVPTLPWILLVNCQFVEHHHLTTSHLNFRMAQAGHVWTGFAYWGRTRAWNHSVKSTMTDTWSYTTAQDGLDVHPKLVSGSENSLVKWVYPSYEWTMEHIDAHNTWNPHTVATFTSFLGHIYHVSYETFPKDLGCAGG